MGQGFNFGWTPSLPAAGLKYGTNLRFGF